MEADINSGKCRDLCYSGTKLDPLTWERDRSADSQHCTTASVQLQRLSLLSLMHSFLEDRALKL